MKKLLLVTIALASVLMLAPKEAKTQSFNPQLASMLQDTLNYYVSIITNIKGMSASVYVPGQGTWQGTAGLSYSGHPITAGMEFGIASNTKLFVAAAMLILAENNIISLNDSLAKWLPTYPNINPNITIRQLLNHTAGVQDPIFLSPWMDTIMKNPTRVFTPAEVLGWVGAPLFAPGTSWSYSNVNYILAGMVAQSATGFHISRIIRDSILTPLNLTNTFYDVEEPEIGTVAHRWYNLVDFNDTSRVGLNTAGGCAGALFSTSADMVKWYHALMSGQVLSSASFAELTNFITTGTAYTYGLALENQPFFGHTTWGHGGVTWGYKSRMVYDPCSGAAVCGLVNSWPAGNDGVTVLLYSVLVNHLPGCGAIITGPTSVCQGQNNVTYSVPAIVNATSYVWTLPGGATGTSSTNSITVNYGGTAVSGTVTVKGTNLYGDGAVSVLPVIVNALPIAAITPSGATTFCSGGSVTLNANTGAGLTYQWNKNGVSVSGAISSGYAATTSGSYTVVVTNSCGSAMSSAVIVTVNSLPSATITPAGATTFCSGGSVVLNAVVAANRAYQWKKGVNLIAGATLPSYTASTGGNYRVIVTNTVTGCSKTTASATVITVNALPAATITPQGPTTFCAGGSVVLTANSGIGLTYKWKKGNAIIGSATMQNYTATTAGTYKVIVTNSNACSKTSAGTVVTVNCREQNLYSERNGLEVFPNPTNGSITLKFTSDENQSCELTVADLTGRKIRYEKINISQGINELSFDMSDFSSGVYFIQMKMNGSEFFGKVVKQ